MQRLHIQNVFDSVTDLNEVCSSYTEVFRCSFLSIREPSAMSLPDLLLVLPAVLLVWCLRLYSLFPQVHRLPMARVFCLRGR